MSVRKCDNILYYICSNSLIDVQRNLFASFNYIILLSLSIIDKEIARTDKLCK